MIPFLDFFKWGILPSDTVKELWLVWWVKSYEVIGMQLYRETTSKILLKCTSSNEGKALLLDIQASI
jgi:hypothetical protein